MTGDPAPVFKLRCYRETKFCHRRTCDREQMTKAASTATAAVSGSARTTSGRRRTFVTTSAAPHAVTMNRPMRGGTQESGAFSSGRSTGISVVDCTFYGSVRRVAGKQLKTR